MAYLGRRIGFYLVTAWAAITMNFFIPRLMPGNPAQTLLSRLSGNGELTPRMVHDLTIAFGLNSNTGLLGLGRKAGRVMTTGQGLTPVRRSEGAELTASTGAGRARRGSPRHGASTRRCCLGLRRGG